MNLKPLQTLSVRLNEEYAVLEQQAAHIGTQIAVNRTEFAKVQKQIAQLTKKEIQVTEHALLRYVERVLNVDINQLKSNILTDNNRAIIDFAGSGTCRIKSNGIEFVVKDRQVISVVK